LCATTERDTDVKQMVKSCQRTDAFWQGESDPMRTGPGPRWIATRRRRALRTKQTGFSLIELLIGMSIMAVALLSIAAMFSTGYTDVHAGGRTTMGTSAARQMIEDIQTLPFDRLVNLNGVNTASAGTLPASNPERDLVRKWRYALAGEGTGWNYTTAEKAMWSILTSGGIPMGANGQIAVVQTSPTLRRITVTVQLPGRTAGVLIPVQLTTLISRL
jgi:prepilin-type N-terminal cleavage/methylation domain-containing protein